MLRGGRHKDISNFAFWNSLHRLKANDPHFYHWTPIDVPLRVRTFLTLGEKLVTNRGLHSYKFFYSSCDEFRKALYRAGAFRSEGNFIETFAKLKK